MREARETGCYGLLKGWAFSQSRRCDLHADVATHADKPFICRKCASPASFGNALKTSTASPTCARPAKHRFSRERNLLCTRTAKRRSSRHSKRDSLKGIGNRSEPSTDLRSITWSCVQNSQKRKPEIRITKYSTRHWPLWIGQDLVAVKVYQEGPRCVAELFQALPTMNQIIVQEVQFTNAVSTDSQQNLWYGRPLPMSSKPNSPAAVNWAI